METKTRDLLTTDPKTNVEMWKELGMDVERVETMRCVMGDVYQKMVMMKDNRPNGMDYFDFFIAELHGGRIVELLEAKKQGRPIVGSFCVFVPEELVLAAGGINLGLCGSSPKTIPDAEKVLPRNICPSVKSSYGFKVSKTCPYYEAVDFICGETTCDAKKKTWEILGREVPIYVMEVPQMKRKRDHWLWLDEVKDFKTHMEKKSGKKITSDDLTRATIIINAKRKALQRLTKLRAHSPAPISGMDAILVEQLAFYDDPVRYTEKVNLLCDELDARVKKGDGVSTKNAPRVMVSGSPMGLPNWKLHHIIETSGGIVVNEENCTGTRSFKDLVDESNGGIDAQLSALTDRYMKNTCACFTPNDERIDQVLKEYKGSNAQGIVHYCLQFCHPYNLESIKIKDVCEKHHIPFLAIETDYSAEDAGQIQTRVEAFLEQVRG